jgi:hypothetical protein
VTVLGPIRVHAMRWYATHHATAADALSGVARAPVLPGYTLLVGRARRFTSLVTQLHVEVCGPLHALAEAPPIGVFATCHGEIRTADALMADLRAGAVVSSARFAQSVHNTAAGAYAVAVGSSASTTTVTGANALAAGWLEAATTVLDGQHVLLSIADEPVPERFAGPAGDEGVAAAFLMTPGDLRLPRAELDRRVELAIVSRGADAASMLTTLAAAYRAIADGAGAVTLGPIAPGATLELRVCEEAA